ncbi:MAG: MarR family transcriptional regulator [Actinomycetota bacterium]|nr:MarR family transcriptional regulator [Actinomycetota bacterium]
MGDAVDVILGQWAAERPDLDARPMAVIGRIARVHHLLDRGVAENLARHGLQRWEFDVLATLRRHRGGPLTAGELAAAMMVASASMTNRIDRLVTRGFVSRTVDPSSRRRVLISLSDAGRALVDEVVSTHVAAEDRLLAGLDEGERAGLADLLRRLLLSLGDRPEAP